MDLLGPLDSSSLQSPLSPETHKRAAQDSEDSASPWRIDNDGRNKVQIRSAFRGEAKQRILSLDEENLSLKAQLAGYQTEKEGLEASVTSAQRAIVEWKEHVKMLQDKLPKVGEPPGDQFPLSDSRLARLRRHIGSAHPIPGRGKYFTQSSASQLPGAQRVGQL
ncbi:hypothetical protein B0H11DRAFT_1913060 [Mycena galericulata]|nr:hypothetical protein B0H11DRAFT_1913060 [Mycena galericulata]